MKIKIFIVLIFGLMLFWVLFLYGRSALTEAKNKVCFQQNCFEVEIASNDKDRERGLMFRDKMDQDKGMLFVFDEESRYPFWMKNTQISLDMIWMDSDWKVVAIKTATPCLADPCPNYDPGANAKYVLEINGGLADSQNIRVGDIAEFRR